MEDFLMGQVTFTTMIISTDDSRRQSLSANLMTQTRSRRQSLGGFRGCAQITAAVSGKALYHIGAVFA
jgi:hypothetical protein